MIYKWKIGTCKTEKIEIVSKDGTIKRSMKKIAVSAFLLTWMDSQNWKEMKILKNFYSLNQVTMRETIHLQIHCAMEPCTRNLIKILRSSLTQSSLAFEKSSRVEQSCSRSFSFMGCQCWSKMHYKLWTSISVFTEVIFEAWKRIWGLFKIEKCNCQKSW